MKRKNFPGRKNMRRIKALNRLQNKPKDTFSFRREVDILESRIIDPEQVRFIETKKRRS